MFGMWDVRCRMFAMMWDVDLQNTDKSLNRLLLSLILKRGKFHMKTSLFEPLFNKAAGLRLQCS